jgi:predicted nucleic acid-binding protein
MIFLDANYIISLYVEAEEDHKRALEIRKKIENEEKLVSKLVIAELINVLYTKLKVDKKLIKRTYEEIKNKYTIIEDSYIFDKTMDKIMDSQKRVPFFDYAIITLMEDLGIKEIATFDKHFDNIDGIVRVH